MAPRIPKFAYRKNDNGTLDSICLGCFVTVATARSDAELESKERDHLCNPWDLRRFESVSAPNPIGPGSPARISLAMR
jgi:hypothetical protein